MYAYNLNPATTPGEMKIRWRVRIATGTEAQHLDKLQQQAILALLTWANKQNNRSGKPSEIPSGNSG
jgi:hypothetical protein